MNGKNDLLDKVITGIEATSSSGLFQDYEEEIIELKDLSSGTDWKSLKQTICAYLNTALQFHLTNMLYL